MTQVETGSALVFAHYPDKYMWTGSGDRAVTVYVKFAHPKDGVPKVSAALGAIDAGNGHNMRVALAVQDIDERGFNLVASTWGDTQLAQVNGNWIAIWP